MDSLEESVNLLFQILDTYDKLSDGMKELFLRRREKLTWGSYGKDGKQPRKEIFIKDVVRIIRIRHAFRLQIRVTHKKISAAVAALRQAQGCQA